MLHATVLCEVAFIAPCTGRACKPHAALSHGMLHRWKVEEGAQTVFLSRCAGTACKPYAALFDEGAWKRLADLFRKDLYRLHSMPLESQLTIHLHVSRRRIIHSRPLYGVLQKSCLLTAPLPCHIRMPAAGGITTQISAAPPMASANVTFA